MRTIQSERDVLELLYAAKALATIAAWSDRGLFDALAEGPKTLDALDGDPRALATTAPVLAHLGLLVGDGHRYDLSNEARALHAAGELPTGRNLAYLRELSRMDEVLAEGGPVAGDDGAPRLTSGGVTPDDPEATRRFLDMLYRTSEVSAGRVLEWTQPRMRAGAAMLDIGGGHGRYARTFADAGFPATVFDMPLVVDLARERHGDALSYLTGDFHTCEGFGGPYGAILLSNIVHGESGAQNADLVRRCHAALEPGGVLVLKDMFIDEQGRDPQNAVFFGLTMLFYTRLGRSYDLAEVNRWLAAAGFGAPEIAVLETHALVFARRSATG